MDTKERIKENEIAVIERGFELASEEMNLIFGGLGEVAPGCNCKCNNGNHGNCPGNAKPTCEKNIDM
jgi:natural product precursor